MAVTQAQIAKLAGVSRGTVDRVLNNRGRVSPDIVEKINKIAADLGYHPNRAGSMLVRSKRPIRLGVIIQSMQTPFMSMLMDEIENIRPHMLELGAELVIRQTQTLDLEQQLIYLEELHRAGIDGLALAPVEDDRVCNKVDEIIADGIPVVTFNTDIPASKRLCYIGLDNYQSGRACAGLMNLLLRGTGTVLMITGYVSNLSQQRRIDGFTSEVFQNYSGIRLLPLERCQDSCRIAKDIVLRELQAHPEINGIYFSAGGPDGGCVALRELGLAGKVHVVCHDLTEDNARNLRDGTIDFLIDQDAKKQATRPLEVLLDKILVNATPPKEYMFTNIDIRNRYNV